MIRQLRRAARTQGTWAVGDQVLSSGTNFAVGILLARTLGAAEFGAFAIAFSVWLVVMGLTRTLIAHPYVIEAAPLDLEAWRPLTRHAAGVIVVLASTGGGIVFIAGATLGLHTSVGSSLAVLAAFVPALALQDFWRLAAFSRQHAQGAAANDGVWAVAQTVVLAGLWATGALSAPTAVAGWGAGAAAGAGFGLFQVGLPSLSRSSWRFARRALPTGAWFTASNALHSVGSQAAILIVAGAAGRAAVGGLRAVANLLAPVQLLSMATESFGLPQAARACSVGPGQLRSMAVRYSRNLTLVAATYGAILVVVGPRLLPAVFGPSFEPFTDLIVPLVLVNICGTLGMGAVLALRAARLGRRLVVAQGIGTTVKLVAVVALVGPHGVTGAAWALASGAAIHTVLLWALLWATARAGLAAPLPGPLATNLGASPQNTSL